MKKLENSGFTLVELVAIIVILAAIFLVAVPTIISTSKDAKNKEYDLMVDILCEAGKSYVYTNDEFELNNNDKTVLYVSELVENNLVDSNIKNPLNNELVNNDVLLLNVKDDSSLDCTYKKYSDYVSRLILNLNGGSYNGLTTITQEPGTVYSVPNNPTKTGYIFGGWQLSGSGNNQIYDTSIVPVTSQIYNYNSASSQMPGVYNNNHNGAVTRSMVADSTADGGYSLKVVTNGTADPWAGGVALNALPEVAGRINVIELKAKIPTGFGLRLAGIGQHYTGIGSTYNHNDEMGTGDWKVYRFAIYTGDTGTIGSSLYIFLDGDSIGNNTNVTWNIDYISIKSYTREQYKTLYTLGDGNGVLTAQWNPSGSKITFEANGGTFNNISSWVNNYYSVSSTSATRYYIYNTNYGTHPGSTNYNWTPDTRVISKAGATFEGWYTSPTGGVQVFDKDGKLNANVSGYSDSSRRWIKCDSNITLYAHWNELTYRLTINPNGGSYNGQTSNTVISQKYNTTYNVQNNPTKSGYVFGGWKLTSGDGDITWYDESDLLRQYKITSASSTKPSVYNNNSNGAVTHTIVTDSTSETGYSLKITTNGTATPGAGGFVNSIMASSGSVFYHEFIAKVPVGYTLTIASNSRGAGSSQYWLTPNVGTGNWETYIYITACGYNGTFSTFGHVCIIGSNNTNVTWYLQESSMYQISNSKASTDATSMGFRFKASDATLTAQWNTTGVGVTYDRQGGSFGNGTIGTKWTKGSDNFIYNTAYTNSKVAPYYISSSDFAIYKDGYTFNGWYTAATGGVQVFDATGKLNANVSGYSDANRKWLKTDANVTLYARWIAN